MNASIETHKKKNLKKKKNQKKRKERKRERKEKKEKEKEKKEKHNVSAKVLCSNMFAADGVFFSCCW